MASSISSEGKGETDNLPTPVHHNNRQSQGRERTTSVVERAQVQQHLAETLDQRASESLGGNADKSGPSGPKRAHEGGSEPSELTPKRAKAVNSKTSATSEVAKADASHAALPQDVSDANRALSDDVGPASLRAVQEVSGSSPSLVIRDTETAVPSSSPSSTAAARPGLSTYRQGEQITAYKGQESAPAVDPRAAAAKDLLLRVARTPYKVYLAKFPEWESRVFQLLGRPLKPESTKLLGEVMRHLTNLKLNQNPAANELLERCVDRILQVLDGFHPIEAGGAPPDSSVVSLEQSVSTANEALSKAQSASGVVRDAVLAWIQVIDSILTAMDVHHHNYQAQQHKLANWEQDQINTQARLWAQEEYLDKNVKLCTKLVSDADATNLLATLELEQLEQEFKEEIAKSDAEFSRVYEAAAARGDFANCTRLHESRADALSANAKISLLQKALSQKNDEALRSSGDKVFAKDNRAYWESLLDLFKVTEQQYGEHVKCVSHELSRAEQDYSQRTAPWVCRMTAALMHALEEYFTRSFRVQATGLHDLDRLLAEKEEHDERLGGYIEFSKTAEIEMYRTIVQGVKEENTRIIEKLQALWKSQLERRDDATTRFAFAELEQTLTGTYEGQWKQIKEPLQQAIDATSVNAIPRKILLGVI